MKMEDLISLYRNQIGKHFPMDESGLQYVATGPMKKDDVYSLYSLRYEIYKESKGQKNPDYERLLENIKYSKESSLAIHALFNSHGSVLLFTNHRNETIIGVLFSTQKSEEGDTT